MLAEDKKYYPTAEETYGAEAETLVMEEDAQPLEVPIIAPVVSKRLEKLLDVPLTTHYSSEFLATLSTNPELIRNVAVGGRQDVNCATVHTGSVWMSASVQASSCLCHCGKLCVGVRP